MGMNPQIRLCYPVKTIDGIELLSAGTLLTESVMQDLVRSSRKYAFAETHLINFDSTAHDIHQILEHPLYSHIVEDPTQIKEIDNAIKNVKLVKPLFEIYKYFKTNDMYTYRHTLSVFILTLLITLKLTDYWRDRFNETMAAPFHDFGKINVPLDILTKSSQLDDYERQYLSHHTAAGYVLLSFYLKDYNNSAAITARDHHERNDGSGYPRGIKLQNRTVEIVAVCDIFDALISTRPYRPQSYTPRTALEALTVQTQRGALSPDIVNALILCLRKKPSSFDTANFSKEQRGFTPSNNLYSGALSCEFDSDIIDKNKD